MIQLETERLILREWRESDMAPFCAINSDEKVMEFFPSLKSEAETRDMVERCVENEEKFGFCFQPLIEKASGDFIGMCGIAHVLFEASFTPAVEIGWRLAVNHWGKGYASEAARALLHHGFTVLGLEEVVALAPQFNRRSRTVMERIGMTHYPDDDFDHPSIPEDSVLRGCVLYRISKP